MHVKRESVHVCAYMDVCFCNSERSDRILCEQCTAAAAFERIRVGFEFSLVELREADCPHVLQLRARFQICEPQKSFSEDKNGGLCTE